MDPLTTFLKRHRGRHLVEVKSRIKDAELTRGFVVDFSDSLVLFHVLDMDTFRLNGYNVLRSDDISHFGAFDKQRFWQNRAISHFNIAPVRPSEISLSSIPDLIKSIAKQYPLIVFHPERKKPDICYVGRLLTTSGATFIIDDLDSTAAWTGPRRLKFDDFTRIGFGGGYENALAATAPQPPKKKLSIKINV